MSAKLLHSLHLKGFLSFGPGSEPVRMIGLNVLIGPNGVGKSNFIEALELLRATPTDFAEAIRLGGTPSHWIWQGEPKATSGRIEAILPENEYSELRYAIEFTDSAGRLEITDELLEAVDKDREEDDDVPFYYRLRGDRPKILASVTDEGARTRKIRRLKRENINLQQAIFSQRRDPDMYPEVTTTGQRFKAIEVFREWSFGRSATLRAPQPADLPTDTLLPNLVNLGLVLNNIEHQGDWDRFNALMRRFLPRYTRLGTLVSSGSVQVYLREDSLSTPIPATRLSDGTLRFLALLAILLNPRPGPLICIEEPELGLHPDAMGLMAELLVETSRRTQLVITTHSDALVSALTEEADSVLVCDYLEHGTTLQRVDSDKLRFWLDKYRLGEIWRLGELGGNP